MAGLDLPEKTLAELRKRHTDFVVSRLASDAGREELVRALGRGWKAALALPVREVVEPQRLADALVRALSTDSVRTLLAPVARDIGRRVTASLAESRSKVGDHVPAAARRAIEELLGRPDLVPERLVRELLAEKAVEHALRDVLFDGLKQFNDTVNPFFADWGIPALLSWLPIGGSAAKASLGTIRAEFDRRLDPEIRKFLLVFSRQATTRLADVLLARSNDPGIVAMRRHVLAYVLARPLASAAAVDEDARRCIEEASEELVVGALEGASLRDSLAVALERFVADQEGRTLGQWLHAIGATGAPDFEAWANLAWPHARRAILSPAFRELVDRVNREFYAGLRRGREA